MKRLSLFITALFFTWQLIAQNELPRFELDRAAVCGGVQTIMNIKGKWKKQPDDINNYPDKTFPRSQYNQVFSRTDKIAGLFQQWNAHPDGLEPRWYRSIRGEPVVKDAGVPYAFNTYYYFYFCNERYKKAELTGETGTMSFIFINQFSWFFDPYKVMDKQMEVEGGKVFRVGKRIGKCQSMDLFEIVSFGQHSHALVITRDSSSPYKPVTRKQYLYYMIEHWPVQKEIFEDELTKSSEEVLKKPASLPLYGKSKQIFDDDEKEGLILATVNLNYFKKELPRYVPQFMVLYWSWNKNAPGLNFKKEFEENFPVEKLKEIIDK